MSTVLEVERKLEDVDATAYWTDPAGSYPRGPDPKN